MPASAFQDETCTPTDDAVRGVLGDAFATWAQLRALIAERIGPVSEVWKYTNAHTGWALRIVHRDRVIFYVTPQPARFIVSLALGARAVAAARTARLSARVLEAIEEAPGNTEGRAVRISVRDGRYIRTLARLAQIKSELRR